MSGSSRTYIPNEFLGGADAPDLGTTFENTCFNLSAERGYWYPKFTHMLTASQLKDLQDACKIWASRLKPHQSPGEFYKRDPFLGLPLKSSDARFV